MAGRELEGFLQNSEQHAVAHCLARMSTKIRRPSLTQSCCRPIDPSSSCC